MAPSADAAAAAALPGHQPAGPSFRVRTVTAFLCLAPGDETTWEQDLEAAGAFLARAEAALQAEGALRQPAGEWWPLHGAGVGLEHMPPTP
jgi:hypothetical protein